MQRPSTGVQKEQLAPSVQATRDPIEYDPNVNQFQTKDFGTRSTWLHALKKVFPLYVVIHVLFLLLSYLVTLFQVSNYSLNSLPLSSLALVWNRWDTSHFTAIATHGYVGSWQTAFFPLFPLLERGVAFLLGGPFRAGLIISNLAYLVVLVVLYRLVWEDFGEETAFRATLFLAVFPTAFFFIAAYSESLFLCLALLSFYYMRCGKWWIAGLFGFFAVLTRASGLLLVLPFLYEYLCQRSFKLKTIRFGLLNGALIPAGLVVFALYCYVRFHDLLAFSHAEKIAWNRELRVPWYGLVGAITTITQYGLKGALSFSSIHNMIDLSAELLMLALVVLSFIGPWKFPEKMRSYALYGAAVYLFSILFPLTGKVPLGALSRFLLEVFPAFVVLAVMFRKEHTAMYYGMVSVSLLSFLTLQFLTGHWII